MKFTRQSLEKFLDLNGISNTQIADLLTNLGFETELLKDWAELHKNLRIAQIVDFSAIKNSKNRWVTITSGGETTNVVCGATNFKKDDYVIWAPPGSILRTITGTKIKLKPKQIGDHTSPGMLCSAEELSLYTATADFPKPEGEIIVLQSFCENFQAKTWKEYSLATDLNVFATPELNDALFETETHFGVPEARSVFGLSLYLAQKLNRKLKTEQIEFHSQVPKLPQTKPTESENEFEATILFEDIVDVDRFGWLTKLLHDANLLKTNTKGPKKINKKQLVGGYLDLFFGISWKIQSVKELTSNSEANKYSLKEIQTKLVDFDSALKVHCLTLNKPKNQEIPCAQVYEAAYEQITELLANLFLNPHQKHHHFRPRFMNMTKFNNAEIWSSVRQPSSEKETLAILKSAGNLIEQGNWIASPAYKKVSHLDDLAVDLIRFSSINDLPEEQIIDHRTQLPKNEFSRLEKKIRDFFVHKGFNEVKIPFVKKQSDSSSSDFVQRLKNSFISDLRKNSYVKKENVFTVDQLFNNNKKDSPNTFITAVFSHTQLINPLVEKTIAIEFHYLTLILRLLLSFFHLQDSYKVTAGTSKELELNLQPMKKDSKIDTLLFHILIHQNYFGRFGYITETKGKTKISHLFLELDLTSLVTNKKPAKKLKFKLLPERPPVCKEITIDLDNTIEPFKNKTNTKDKLPPHYFSWLINHLRSYDKNLIKTEIINIDFKGRNLRVRFWKNNDPDRTLDEIFSKVISKSEPKKSGS